MSALLHLACRFALDGPAWLPRPVRRVPLVVLARSVAWSVYLVRLMRATH